jgi:predicted amidophosphoribosyltransferase
VHTQCATDFRSPAKNLAPHERAKALRNQFSVTEDLTGRSVLIVDDVYRSGVSIAETARAAHAAGAETVQALCAVRTLRL